LPLELGQITWYSDRAEGWKTRESGFNSPYGGEKFFSLLKSQTLALRLTQPLAGKSFLYTYHEVI